MKANRKKELEHKKKELKEDAFVGSVTKAYETAAPLGKYILGGLAGVLLALVVIGLMRAHNQKANARAWAAVAEFQKRMADLSDDETDNDKLEAKMLAGLDSLVDETKGTAAHPMVVFQYIQALFEKGGEENIKKAGEQAEFFLENYPKNYYALAVHMFLGKAQLEQGKTEQALKTFQYVQEEFRSDEFHVMQSLKPEALYYTGRCQEKLGDIRNARLSFERLTQENDGIWAQMAQFSLSKIKS